MSIFSINNKVSFRDQLDYFVWNILPNIENVKYRDTGEYLLKYLYKYDNFLFINYRDHNEDLVDVYIVDDQFDIKTLTVRKQLECYPKVIDEYDIIRNGPWISKLKDIINHRYNVSTTIAEELQQSIEDEKQYKTNCEQRKQEILKNFK